MNPENFQNGFDSIQYADRVCSGKRQKKGDGCWNPSPGEVKHMRQFPCDRKRKKAASFQQGAAGQSSLRHAPFQSPERFSCASYQGRSSGSGVFALSAFPCVTTVTFWKRARPLQRRSRAGFSPDFPILAGHAPAHLDVFTL